MRKKHLIYTFSTLLLGAAFTAPARADFVPILDPITTGYYTITNLMPAGGLEGDSASSVTDGTHTASFLISSFPTTLTIHEIGVGWSTWSSPPFAETSTPLVLDGATPQLEIQLDTPALVFGFEAEPQLFGLHSITASFFGGGSFRGSITTDVEGDSGARLFAGFSSMGIDDIFISSTDDFAIAQLRVGDTSPVPEPRSLMLLAGVAMFLSWFGSRRVLRSRQQP